MTGELIKRLSPTPATSQQNPVPKSMFNTNVATPGEQAFIEAQTMEAQTAVEVKPAVEVQVSDAWTGDWYDCIGASECWPESQAVSVPFHASNMAVEPVQWSLYGQPHHGFADSLL